MPELTLEEIQAEIALREGRGDLSLEEIQAEIALREREFQSPLMEAGGIALDATEQFAAGAAEGTAGVLGLLSDAGEGLAYLISPGLKRLKPEPYNPLDLKNTQEIVGKVKEYLPEEKDGLIPRYARTAGEFVGPGAGLRAVKEAKNLKKAKDLLSAPVAKKILIETAKQEVPAAIGAQVAEDQFPDSSIAPVIGAVAGSGVSSGARAAYKGTKQALRKATPQEIRANVAQILQDMTGLKGSQVRRALSKLPDDELAKWMTTAEVTENAGFAQLQKELTKEGAGALKAFDRANLRENLRRELIDSLSAADNVDKEDVGAALREATQKRKAADEAVAHGVWQKFPRDELVHVGEGQKLVANAVDHKEAGLGLHRSTVKLVDQFLEGMGDASAGGRTKTSGYLQDIRSDALKLLREGTFDSDYDEVVLAELVGQIDNAMNTQLSGGAEKMWTTGREITRNIGEKFDRRTTGGKLLNEQTATENLTRKAVRGSRASIKELRVAVGKDPQLIENVKGVVLDEIPTDAAGRLTIGGMKRFLRQRKNALRELFGEEHYGQLERILDDLRYEAGVKDSALHASKRMSPTAQSLSMSEAISKRILDRSFGEGLPIIGDAIQYIRNNAQVSNVQQMKDLLLRAAMEPEYAALLLDTPTDEKVVHGIESLASMVSKAIENGGRSGFIALGRDSSSSNRDRKSRRELHRESREHSLQKNSRGSSSDVQSLSHSFRGREETGGLRQYPRGRKGQEPRAQLSRMSYSSSNDLTNIDPNQAEELALELAFNELITPEVLDAVATVESSNNSRAVSKAGAKGMYQLMDSTGERLHRRLGLPGEYDPFDPVQARILAAAHLDDGLRRFPGRLDLALADYNAGDPRMREAIELAGSDEWAALEEAFRLMQLDETAEYVPKYRELGVI